MSIKFMEKVLHQINFSYGGDNDSIFYFGQELSYNFLFLRTQIDRIGNKRYNIG